MSYHDQIEKCKKEYGIKKEVDLTEIEKGEGEFIKVKKGLYELNNGAILKREEIIKGDGGGNAAIILPLTKEGNVLLTVQPRVFTKNVIPVEFPAGYIDKEEKGKDAAIRELEEETGYTCSDIKKLISYYQDQGCSRAYNDIYLALGCEKVKEQKLDKDEYVEYFECSYDEMLELAHNEIICDAGSLLAIYSSYDYIKNELDEISNGKYIDELDK